MLLPNNDLNTFRQTYDWVTKENTLLLQKNSL